MEAPRFKEVRRAYGFDEIAIAPGSFTINPDQTSTDFSIDGMTMSMPILAAAMDAIVSPSFAAKFDDLGRPGRDEPGGGPTRGTRTPTPCWKRSWRRRRRRPPTFSRGSTRPRSKST